MSLDQAARKKRSVADTSVKRTSEDDHRRKRRNRTTQSCLNCHTSKRMCDRKRPCGRCTQLGLTGLCVYEVDDPSQSHDSHDDKSRLQKRVAELESVIRELKNKPHPRWINTGPQGMDTTEKCHNGLPDGTRVKGSAQDTPPSPAGSVDDRGQPTFGLGPHSGYTTPSRVTAQSSPFLSIRSPASSSSLSPIAQPSPLSLSPIDTQLPRINMGQQVPESDCDLSALFLSCQTQAAQIGLEDGLFNDIFDPIVGYDSPCSSGHMGDHCGCLDDPASYNVVLELSLRLRKAAELLGRFSRHDLNMGICTLNHRIVELDRFVTIALGNVAVPPDDLTSYPHHERPVIPIVPSNQELAFAGYTGARPMSLPTGPTISPPSLQSLGSWDVKAPGSYPSPPWDDTFMSWVPQRQ